MRYTARVILILHNIRSAHNVGSMFRTADAAGVSKVILSGYTPGPVDPRGKERRAFAKVSLGAERYVPWERTKTLAQAIKKLKKENVTIIGVEQNKKAVPLFNYTPPPTPCALVVGNEVRGLSPQAVKRCDVLVEIPMRHSVVRQAHHPRHTGRGKESLNVSVACGVALFTLLK